MLCESAELCVFARLLLLPLQFVGFSGFSRWFSFSCCFVGVPSFPSFVPKRPRFVPFFPSHILRGDLNKMAVKFIPFV